eukprot:TRINITY_DN24396_c0_g2_i1.p1 TRINITY_DN24396_c0_g2~~TRINITY_DN24396_c0_g2_i1.p1  ORF type:complete len:526 (-),score=110.82 TRINITY_DN24396_c0_g2_i1:152-1729(-)
MSYNMAFGMDSTVSAAQQTSMDPRMCSPVGTATLVHNGGSAEALVLLLKRMATLARYGDDEVKLVMLYLSDAPGCVDGGNDELVNTVKRGLAALPWNVVAVIDGTVGMTTARILCACSIILATPRSVLYLAAGGHPSGARAVSASEAVSVGFVDMMVSTFMEAERMAGVMNKAVGVKIQQQPQLPGNKLDLQSFLKAGFAHLGLQVQQREASRQAAQADLEAALRQRAAARSLEKTQTAYPAAARTTGSITPPPGLLPPGFSAPKCHDARGRLYEEEHFLSDGESSTHTGHSGSSQSEHETFGSRPSWGHLSIDQVQLPASPQRTVIDKPTPMENRASKPVPATTKSKGGTSYGNTYMLCNIPCRATQQQVVDAVNSLGFAGTYDFIHLPTGGRMSKHTKNTTNLGYCFINFLHPETGSCFTSAFEGYTFACTTSLKKCTVKPAHIQLTAEQLKSGGVARLSKAASKKAARSGKTPAEATVDVDFTGDAPASTDVPTSTLTCSSVSSPSCHNEANLLISGMVLSF